MLVVTIAANAIAQTYEGDHLPPDQRASKLTEWMKTNLQLTADQEKQTQEINLKYANKTEELKNSSESKGQKLRKIKEYNESKESELKKVFTDEQFKIYQTKKEEIKDEFKAKAKEKRKS